MFGLNNHTRAFAAVAVVCALVFGLAPANTLAATVTPYVYTYQDTVNVGSNSATVSGQAYTSPSNNVIEFGIAYSTGRNDSSPVYRSTTSSSGSYDVSLTGLSNSTKYYYRAYIKYYTYTNANTQDIAYGTEYNFTTLSGSSSSSSSDPVVNVPRMSSISGTEALAESSYVSNGHTVRYAGFVYSSTNTSPTRNDTDLYDQVTETSQSFSKRITSLTKNTTYYVRAYISVSTNSSSYTDLYSPVATFVTSTTSLPEVETQSVTNIHSTGADVVINVTSSGTAGIAERGVVYSMSMSTPDLYSSDCKYKSVSGTTGEATVALTGLESNRTYYARAYVRNENGVYYGQTRSFDTQNSVNVKTSDVSNLTSGSALASGSISDVSSFTLVEKGFVYSKSEQNPTINDSKVSTSASSTGSYNLELTGLQDETTYYVRAYAKTSDSYSYGNVITYTTPGSAVTLKISYMTLNGSVVGQETLTASAGKTLTAEDLQMPSGYNLQMSNWQYTVSRSEDITVAVVGGASVTGAFMEGTGNYMFAPDRAATRAEVAEAIYSIAGRQSGSIGMSFSDVPANYKSKDAINYVSSKSYMQGYPDGSFKPDGTITRAEVCVILNMMYSPQGASTTTAFKDIEPTDWHYKYVALAYNNKMIYGFEDGTFQPNGTTTRAQICTMLVNSEKRQLTPLGTAQFTDVPSTHWAYNYIMSAAVPAY